MNLCFQVQAYDADEGVNAELTYTLTDKEYSNNELPIAIDPRSGWVYTSGQLDRETQAKYQLQVNITADLLSCQKHGYKYIF